MSEQTGNIYQKLAKVRKQVEVIRKNKSGYGYKYVTEDEILAKISVFMDKYHLSLVPSIQSGTTRVEPYTYKKTKTTGKGEFYEENNNEILVSADMTWSWVNNDNPEERIDVNWALVGQQSDIAGLVAAGDHPSPFGLADIITTTTHKTLRGTRGGLIFCKPELAKRIDSAVFPCCQGGALQHIIAGKAVTAEEACTDEFRNYIHAVVRNCKAMCDAFISMGYKVVTGGTDNHLFLLDLTETGLTGKAVQDELDKHGITLNKNCVPNETRSPQQTSGVRIGTAAMTTKGYTAEDFIRIAHTIDTIIKSMQEELHD